ncbi:hypothetical protein CJF30_00008507 [Rutstroemia sp. NJR-2017a BBW]|nr:hypothetical protein CJF30_00008507 [Rutstroemia sp. NJR-2017a BBW]
MICAMPALLLFSTWSKSTSPMTPILPRLWNSLLKSMADLMSSSTTPAHLSPHPTHPSSPSAPPTPLSSTPIPPLSPAYAPPSSPCCTNPPILKSSTSAPGSAA